MFPFPVDPSDDRLLTTWVGRDWRSNLYMGGKPIIDVDTYYNFCRDFGTWTWAEPHEQGVYGRTHGVVLNNVGYWGRSDMDGHPDEEIHVRLFYRVFSLASDRDFQDVHVSSVNIATLLDWTSAYAGMLNR